MGGGPGGPWGAAPDPPARGQLPEFSRSPAERRRGHQHFLKPLERHLRDGGWGGGPFGRANGPTLSFFPPPGRLRSFPSAPLPPNDQLPATLLPGAARAGWRPRGNAARITSAYNSMGGGREARREDGCGVRFLTMVIRHSGRARRRPPTRAARGARAGEESGSGSEPSARRAGGPDGAPGAAGPGQMALQPSGPLPSSPAPL